MGFTGSPTLQTLLARRLNRRRLLGRGAELAVLGVAARYAQGQTGEPSSLTFPRVAPSKADAVDRPRRLSHRRRASLGRSFVCRWRGARCGRSRAGSAARARRGDRPSAAVRLQLRRHRLVSARRRPPTLVRQSRVPDAGTVVSRLDRGTRRARAWRVRARAAVASGLHASDGRADRRRAHARREVGLRARLALQPARHGAHGDGDDGPGARASCC